MIDRTGGTVFKAEAKLSIEITSVGECGSDTAPLTTARGQHTHTVQARALALLFAATTLGHSAIATGIASALPRNLRSSATFRWWRRNLSAMAVSSEVLSMRRGGVVARVLRHNGLSLTLLMLFVAFLIGQIITGQHHYNDERVDHGKPVVTLSEYMRTGDFLEATAENWESEFLQMAAYVLFTAFLFQRGSSESKKIGVQEAVDRDPALVKYREDMPWPVRHGGWILKLYSYSLSIALFTLFLASLGLHGIGGAAAHNEEQLSHGGQAVSVLGYMATSQFWFESFQNWQSEFLSIAVMVIFSIFLRHRGSPESKPVDASHEETGTG